MTLLIRRVNESLTNQLWGYISMLEYVQSGSTVFLNMNNFLTNPLLICLHQTVYWPSEHSNHFLSSAAVQLKMTT
uniref:Uncharacterized protein n=1 Tax=Rhizophora mucronata TaxID=61149 RepID=A0A2P2PE09_RHIMU